MDWVWETGQTDFALQNWGPIIHQPLLAEYPLCARAEQGDDKIQVHLPEKMQISLQVITRIQGGTQPAIRGPPSGPCHPEHSERDEATGLEEREETEEPRMKRLQCKKAGGGGASPEELGCSTCSEHH